MPHRHPCTAAAISTRLLPPDGVRRLLLSESFRSMVETELARALEREWVGDEDTIVDAPRIRDTEPCPPPDEVCCD